MTSEEFYAEKLELLTYAQKYLLDIIGDYPMIQCQSRIKSPESMMEKLKRKGLKADVSSALANVYDALGIRVICGFIDDVYRVAGWLEKRPEIEVIKEKDYISYPKPSGYRSYHQCIKIREGRAKGVLAEIQIRTMALDFWATLEHQLKYKKEIPHEDMIRRELKRCADEIASTDMTMQSIRDMLEG